VATDNLGLTLPTDGGSEDTWGGLLNTALGAIDAAFANRFPTHIDGLTLSAAGGSASFGIASGVAIDTTSAKLLRLAAAITKTTSAWAVGTGNGGLDTGSIAINTWYHVYLIKRLDTAVVDVIFSLNASTPALPANYTVYRCIGSVRTDASSQWKKFSQIGDDFTWGVPVNDLAVTDVGTTPVMRTLTVPTGRIVKAKVRGLMANPSPNIIILVTGNPEDSAVAGATDGNVTAYSQVASQPVGFDLPGVTTNTSAQVRTVASDNSGTTLYLTTYGWIDNRGKA
jgi:hypothetical protein